MIEGRGEGGEREGRGRGEGGEREGRGRGEGGRGEGRRDTGNVSNRKFRPSQSVTSIFVHHYFHLPSPLISIYMYRDEMSENEKKKNGMETRQEVE